MISLFGEEIPDIDKNTSLGRYVHFRAINNYRLGKPYERCALCLHRFSKRWRRDRRVFKCALQGCSCSANSDIRLKNVCNLFARNMESVKNEK